MKSSIVPPPSVEPADRTAWRAWLAANHVRTTGVWLIRRKKNSGGAHFSYDDAVEEALCFGWIDSKPRTLDAARSQMWFSPRQPGTGWSRLNKERVARLIREKRMTPAGRAKVDAAKRDGSWSALDAVENLEVPPDLAAALRGTARAEGFFVAFPRSVKRSILEWIAQAKRPETRAARVAETARLAAKNVRANQWRQPGGAA